MGRRFQKFDKSNREVQRYLSDDDECYYLGDFVMKRGYQHSDYNSFILNLKHTLPLSDWTEKYKNRAIENASVMLRDALALDEMQRYSNFYLVMPMPSSKSKRDPEYDDRLKRICQQMLETHPDIALEEIVLTRESRNSLRSGLGNRDPEELVKTFKIKGKKRKLELQASTVLVLDDVITSGATFVACKQLLIETYPGIHVIGIFLARAVPPDDEDEFDIEIAIEENN